MTDQDNMHDTIRTTLLATAGFMVQLTTWDIVIRIVIGVFTAIFLAVKIGILVTRNWDNLMHPWRYIAKRRRIKANRQETTTTTS